MAFPKPRRLLLAVVLPFHPFVESGIFKRQPLERLPLSGSLLFEMAAEELWQKLLRPMGFRLKGFSRVPYLCKGDMWLGEGFESSRKGDCLLRSHREVTGLH